MKVFFSLSFMILTMAVGAQRFVDTPPKWYDSPPQSNRKFYGVGVGTAKDMYIAENKAKLIANVSIAEQVDSIRVLQIKKTTRTKEGVTNKETSQKEIVEASLSGVNVYKKVYMKNGDEITVYVLLEMKKKR